MQVLQQQARAEEAAVAALTEQRDERAAKAEAAGRVEEKERRALRANQVRLSSEGRHLLLRFLPSPCITNWRDGDWAAVEEGQCAARPPYRAG